MIYVLKGNTIRDIALPLQLLTVEESSQTVTDYYPQPTDVISVRMVSASYIEPVSVSVEDNYLHWEWTPELTGTYGIEVRITTADDIHMRSYRKQQIRVYNSNDQMPEDDGEVEFISEYLVLDATTVVWVKGDPGVGIANIAKTSTVGLVDTYTITYTDGTTSTFDVTNGQDATLDPEQIQQIIDEVIASIDIPTKTSDLTNDSGFISVEVDPTVPAWAKADSKPSYTATEVGAVPKSRTVNGKALSSNITLTAADVNALPSSTVIPTKTSDLTNDSGYITTYTETDPVFTGSPAYSITSSDISSWNGKGTYSKPSGGIPKTDLASAVQTSLGKADTSLQPSDVVDSLSSGSTSSALSANQGKVLNESKQATIDASHKLSADLVDDTSTTNKFVTSSEKTTWNGKQDAISDLATIRSGAALGATSVQSVKTINGNTMTGTGNVSTMTPVTNHGTSDTTYSVTSNVLHIWGTVASLTLTLATPTDNTIVNEYMIEFVSGSTATTLSLPSSVEWAESCGALSVESSKTYQISIVNNIGLWAAISNS